MPISTKSMPLVLAMAAALCTPRCVSIITPTTVRSFAGRVVAREVVRQRPHAAARARAVRRKARGRDRGGRLRVGFDQRNDDAFGAGIERLADRDRACIRGAHQHRHAVGDEADRVPLNATVSPTGEDEWQDFLADERPTPKRP